MVGVGRLVEQLGLGLEQLAPTDLGHAGHCDSDDTLSPFRVETPAGVKGGCSGTTAP